MKCSVMISVALFANAATLAGASGFLRAGPVTESDAAGTLAEELEGVHGRERLGALEDALRPTFAALPKDSAGGLGHRAVRYALHRLFVQRHGWYIKGLEPGADSTNATVQDWVPSFLQSRLEQRTLGRRGASLPELAALAAALEDLVGREASDRVARAYGALGHAASATLDREQVLEAVFVYYAGFLDGSELSAESPEGARRELQNFVTDYVGWAEAEAWLLDTLAPLLPAGKSAFSFNDAVRMAAEIGEKYHTLNDLECRSLKGTMSELEGRRPGRVRLPAFYKKGLYSHWQFDERPEYLRAVGALDESEPSEGSASVILPNYLSARTNCLEASGLYALCCRNECEDLLGRLEREVGAPQAPELEIAGLVAELPSDTVQAPRSLPASLLGRLSEIAAANGGAIPLHGRLFAQWMHHAFPRECPYPHEAGTASPQTPDDWMRKTGQETAKMSREEMQQEVEADTCAFEPEAGPASGCGGSEELPWSAGEELLDEGGRPLGEAPRARPGALWLGLLGSACAFALRRALGDGSQKPGRSNADMGMQLPRFA